MRRVICFVFILIFLLPIKIHSYVIVFHRHNPLIYEISWRTIVVYDRENQKVGLVPQISFNGKPQDFCVVVPTPSVPRLNTIASGVFFDLEHLTSPILRERGSGCLFSDDIIGGAEEDVAKSEEVEIIKEQSVGVFDAVTLSATDPNSLINWLQDNGYGYSAQDKDVIDYYIQRGWVFTAMKIGTSTTPGMSEYYRYNVNPVIFRYSASSLIYPIRLISINAETRTNIVVYILSDTKMTFQGARVQYANKISDKELKRIMENYPAFGGLIGQNRYLTKLKRTFSILEMDADIEIVPDTNEREFKEVIYYGFSPAYDLLPLGIIASLFIAFRFLRRKTKGQA